MFIAGAKWDRVDVEPAFPLGQLGSDRNGKFYKYLQYKEGTAAVDGEAGEVAAYLKESAVAVTSDYSDSDSIGAGVLQAKMSDNEYGWFQIKGPATLSIALTAGADGNTLTVTGAGDGTLDVTIDAGDAGILQHVCAYAIDADEKLILCDFPW